VAVAGSGACGGEAARQHEGDDTVGDEHDEKDDHRQAGADEGGGDDRLALLRGEFNPAVGGLIDLADAAAPLGGGEQLVGGIEGMVDRLGGGGDVLGGLGVLADVEGAVLGAVGSGPAVPGVEAIEEGAAGLQRFPDRGAGLAHGIGEGVGLGDGGGDAPDRRVDFLAALVECCEDGLALGGDVRGQALDLVRQSVDVGHRVADLRRRQEVVLGGLGLPA
jgi:hypothetical protein